MEDKWFAGCFTIVFLLVTVMIVINSWFEKKAGITDEEIENDVLCQLLVGKEREDILLAGLNQLYGGLIPVSPARLTTILREAELKGLITIERIQHLQDPSTVDFYCMLTQKGKEVLIGAE